MRFQDLHLCLIFSSPDKPPYPQAIWLPSVFFLSATTKILSTYLFLFSRFSHFLSIIFMIGFWRVIVQKVSIFSLIFCVSFSLESLFQVKKSRLPRWDTNRQTSTNSQIRLVCQKIYRVKTKILYSNLLNHCLTCED